jgi:hypothetical protein
MNSLWEYSLGCRFRRTRTSPVKILVEEYVKTEYREAKYYQNNYYSLLHYCFHLLVFETVALRETNFEIAAKKLSKITNAQATAALPPQTNQPGR